jgi:hypothetical protein
MIIDKQIITYAPLLVNRDTAAHALQGFVQDLVGDARIVGELPQNTTTNVHTIHKATTLQVAKGQLESHGGTRLGLQLPRLVHIHINRNRY